MAALKGKGFSFDIDARNGSGFFMDGAIELL
jgi:hypothetical protein